MYIPKPTASCNLLHTFTPHSSAVPTAICCTPSHPTPLQCQLHLQSAAHLHIPLFCSASCCLLHTFTSHSCSASCSLLHTFTSHSSAVPAAISCTPSYSTPLQLQSAAHLHIPLLCNLLHTFTFHSSASCNLLHIFTFHSSAICSGSPHPFSVLLPAIHKLKHPPLSTAS